MTDIFDTLINIEYALAKELIPNGCNVTIRLPPDVERYILESYKRSLQTIRHAMIDGDIELMQSAPLTALTVAFYTGYRAGRGDTVIPSPERM